jgi:hypothetical protein
MKIRWNNFTPEYYIRHVRRQSKHVQHIHALVFAGVITSTIAGFILYTDYGFWHERYERPPETPAEPVPTSQSFGDFWQEAKVKFSQIGSSGADLLEGKEVYKKEGE